VFGGYCAYGVSRNKLVEIDVDAFQVVDGKLLLQYSKGVRDDFNKDTQGNLTKANANWPALVEKKGEISVRTLPPSRPTKHMGPSSKSGRAVDWACRILAAAILLQTLFFKFTGAPESVYIFTKVGS